MSLKWRILLFSAASILAILALLSFFGISASRDSTQQTLAERLVLCEQVAHNVDFNIQQVFRQISAVSTGDLEKDSSGQPVSTELLKNVKRLLPFDVEYLYLIDNQGRVVMTEPLMADLVGQDVSQNDFILPAFELGKPLMSNAVFDNYVGKYVSYMVVPLEKNESWDEPMVISAAIGLSYSSIGHLINVTVAGKTSYVEIVDGQGMVLASSNPDKLLKASDHGGLFASLIRNKQTSVSTCHSCHDDSNEEFRQREIITFAPLSTAPWGVVLRQSEEEALASTRLLQQRLTISGLIALFLILLPVVLFASRSIIAPINKLTVASRKIAQGSLEEEVNIQGKNEISTLAQSFNTMRIKLKESIEGIKQRTTELEGLNAIALTLSQSLDLDNILKGVLNRVMGITKIEAGGILLLDEKSGRLSYRVQQGFSDRSIGETKALEQDESIEGKVINTGEPIIISDLRSQSEYSHPLEREGIRAFISFPLRLKDKVVGVMNLVSSEPRVISPNDKQLLFSITNQISIAIENARLYEDLRDKEKMLTELLKNSISTQEDERKRIARELHDETSQALTTLAIGLETIAKSPPSDVERLKLALKKNQELTYKILEEVHRLILDLRPSILDDLGLIPALQWYAKNRLEPEGVKVCLETSGTEKRLPSHIEVALFRIAQEAISNISKHAHAEIVSITLDFNTHFVKLTVEDDGIGFDSNEVLVRRNDKRGFGLLGMMERAETMGGDLAVKSQVGAGTQINIIIPISWDGAKDG